MAITTTQNRDGGQRAETETGTHRMVRCPACGGDSVYATSNTSRPFCSARCKGMDLGAWASESFRLAALSPDNATSDPNDLH